MDPAALGTMMIGLDSVRLERELTESEPTVDRPRRRRRRVVRYAIAVGLHRIADNLEPATASGPRRSVAVGG
jgi:hypothetical protein